MPSPYVIGLDLAGPGGAARTGVAVFCEGGEKLRFERHRCDGSDPQILALVSGIATDHPVVVGVDAPLSYEPGGRQRASDADLRRRLVRAGLPPGSVMSPTAPRMVYLTLRGVVLARAMSSCKPVHPLEVVEVHPSAVFALRGAPPELVRAYKNSEDAQHQLLMWLGAKGVAALPGATGAGSHFVAACAAALSAWRWYRGAPAWLAAARPPWHPYDFAC